MAIYDLFFYPTNMDWAPDIVLGPGATESRGNSIYHSHSNDSVFESVLVTSL